MFHCSPHRWFKQKIMTVCYLSEKWQLSHSFRRDLPLQISQEKGEAQGKSGRAPARYCRDGNTTCNSAAATPPPMSLLPSSYSIWHTSETGTANRPLQYNPWLPPFTPGNCHWKNWEIIWKEGKQEEMTG